MDKNNANIVLLGSGCFWHPEMIFHRTDGVISTKVGYAGGTTENPTYAEVCSGQTGHAEVVKVEFDTNIIDFSKLLDCLLYTSPSPRDIGPSRMPSSA